MIDRSKLSNSFEFVVTAGARARQLLAGSIPRVASASTRRRPSRSRKSSQGGREDRTGGAWSRATWSPITESAMTPMLIALGVTGGIGAYKAVEVARGLQKRGHDVVAVMTASATRFVGAAHLRGHHPAPGHHRPVRARRERRHRAHRARVDDRSAARSRRRRPTSSASSPTASPTIFCRRSTPRRARRCWSRRR